MRYFLPKVNIQIYQGDTIVQNVTGIVSAEFNSSYTSITNGTRLSSITPSGKEFDSTKIDEYVANQFAGFSRIVIFPTEDVYPYEIYAFIGLSDNRIIMRGGVYNSENEYYSTSLNTSIYRATLYPYIEFSVSDSGYETLNIRAESRNGTTTYEIFGGLSGTDIIEYSELGKLVGIEAEPSGPISYTSGNTYNIVIFNVYEGGARFAPLQYGTTYSATIDGVTIYANANYMVVKIPDTISETFIVTFNRDSYSIAIKFINEGVYDPDSPGPYDPGGSSTGGGGGGSFDYPDPFDQIVETPVGSAEADSSSLGIFTRYLMSRSSLTRFGDYLYSDNLIDAVVMELMKLLYSTPAEALISLISYPFNVSSLLSSTPSNVFFGNGDTGIASDGRLTETAAQINWGSILVKGWTGSFLDFSPHTKFDLYLPWCTGTVSLDPSEILTDRSTGISGDVATGQIQIRTNIEIAKGTCMHMVYNGDGVCLGTYSGVCGSQLPITALDTSGKALAFVTAAVSTIAAGAAAAAGAAMGGMASAGRTAGAISPMSEASQLKQATLNGGHSPAVPNYSRGIAGAQAVSRGAARVAVDSARAAAITPPSISRNGSFTANGSGMSIQYPYLIVSYPERDIPERYSSHYGYPSNIYKQLGSLDGYTEVAAIHLDGLSCTEPELSELDELLKGGVIL